MRSVVILIIVCALALLLWTLNEQFPGRLSDDFQLSNLTYLLAVLVLVAPGLVWTFRGRMGQAALFAAIWGIVLLVILTIDTFRAELAPIGTRLKAELLPSSAQLNASGELVIRRSQDGHFYVDVFINGQKVYCMVDTGASHVALSYEDAQRIGIDMDSLEFTMPVSTANGLTTQAYVELDAVAIPPLMLYGVRAMVAKQGQLSNTLLGMSFLNGLSGYRVDGDQLTLWQ